MSSGFHFSECCAALSPQLMQLAMISELKDFFVEEKKDDLNLILGKWRVERNKGNTDFMYVEPVLTQRVMLCNMACWPNKMDLLNTRIKVLEELADKAEEQGHLQKAALIISMRIFEKHFLKLGVHC